MKGFIATLFSAALALSILFVSNAGHAATCGWTASSTQYDSFYGSLWGCQQSRITDMWNRFDFDAGDWDNGFGYEAACDNSLPLKRTFNALQLLAYGVTASPRCTTGGNVAEWAYCWSGNNIDELDARCASGTARARTQFGPIVDNWTELYAQFFYNETVVQRAATIFHEARHANGWCSHTSVCADGADSCDPNWSNGCVGTGSGSGPGANAYTVLYLNWFATTARSTWISTAIRADAVAEGNRYLSRRFGTDPCMRMNSSGGMYSTC